MLRHLVLLLTAAGLRADDLRLNQIQVIGTHNSYHVAPRRPSDLIAATGKAPRRGLDYTHRPLAEQFDELGRPPDRARRVRRPRGGPYADPAARKIARRGRQGPGPGPQRRRRARRPGFKVLHVQDIDYRATVADVRRRAQPGPRLVEGPPPARPDHGAGRAEGASRSRACRPAGPVRRKAASTPWTPRSARSSGRTRCSRPTTSGALHESLPEAIRRTAGRRSTRSAARSCSPSTTRAARATSTSRATRRCRGRAMFAQRRRDGPPGGRLVQGQRRGRRLRPDPRARSKAGFLVRTRADADTPEGPRERHRPGATGVRQRGPVRQHRLPGAADGVVGLRGPPAGQRGSAGEPGVRPGGLRRTRTWNGRRSSGGTPDQAFEASPTGVPVPDPPPRAAGTAVCWASRCCSTWSWASPPCGRRPTRTDPEVTETHLYGPSRAANKVAVVRADGPLVEGLEPAHPAADPRGPRDGQVEAVVLRIDSPGGTIGASEDVHRELTRLRAGGHPRFPGGEGQAARRLDGGDRRLRRVLHRHAGGEGVRRADHPDRVRRAGSPPPCPTCPSSPSTTGCGWS